MSREHVKAFYERLGKDEAFKAQIESAESKQECSQIVRKAGYIFTQEEFEKYTSQLLESNSYSSEELKEKELESAVGGINALFEHKDIKPMPMYGLPPDLIDF